MILKRQYFFYRGHRYLFPKSPTTFSEKIQWRVLHDRRELIALGGDKISMKEYVASLNLGISIPQTLWHGADLQSITDHDWQCEWVLKPITGSGYSAFGEGSLGSSGLDLSEIASWTPLDAYHVKGEWQYSQSRPGFLIEEKIPTSNGTSPNDYRFFVFDGVVRFIQVDTPRVEQVHRRFYTDEWEPLDVLQGKALLAEATNKPSNFDRLKYFAEIIGQHYDFIRVDLYDADGQIWFGELTPCPAGGVAPFIPTDFDDVLGHLWHLPSANSRNKVL